MNKIDERIGELEERACVLERRMDVREHQIEVLVKKLMTIEKFLKIKIDLSIFGLKEEKDD